jgi:hypothetical protein
MLSIKWSIMFSLSPYIKGRKETRKERRAEDRNKERKRD